MSNRPVDGKISNIKRLRQIVSTFIKHGLGQMMEATGLDTYVSLGKRLLLRKEGEEESGYTNPERVVMVFEELGPTFIKLGQILSSRRDQLPREYIAEFEKLQDGTTPLEFEKLDPVFQSEFGKSALEAFDYINKTAMASGSVGQVHEARLKTGEEVVVKIRKPGIEHIINADIKILYFLANRIRKMVLKDNDMFDPAGMVKEFETVIQNELDFSQEGKNIERFQHNFKERPEVHFPLVYWEYTSPRVLVMEKIIGIPVGEVDQLRENGHNLKKIAENLFQFTLKQLFVDAFFHADPHSGNVIIMEDDVLGIIDCGMVGFMQEYFYHSFKNVFIGLFLKDYDLVVDGYIEVGTITDDVDEEIFKNDIRTLAEHYMNISINTPGMLSSLFTDTMEVAARNKMKLPCSMMLSAKALVTMEGTLRKIDPSFDFVGYSTRFAQTMVIDKKFDPKKLVYDLYKFISSMADLSQALPRQTKKILTMVEQQKIGINVTLSGSDEFYRKIDSYVVRISLSVIAAGLAVGSSLVIQSRTPPLWNGISLWGLFGYSMGIVMGLCVLYSFWKRGE